MGRVKPLNNTQIKNFKPKKKEYKVADGDGLYIHIKPTGSKLWRMRYLFNSKYSTKSLGKYPDVSLESARDKLREYKEQIKKGIKPNDNMNIHDSLSFKELAYMYLEHRGDLSDDYQRDIKGILNRDFFPYIGYMDVNSIEPIYIIKCIRRMEDRGIKTATKKSGALLNRIFKYGTTLQLTNNNPMSLIDMSIILKPHKTTNFAHITNIDDFTRLLKDIDNYIGDISTKCALELMPYVFLRPVNIRTALWSEFDFKNKVWIINKDKMKMNRDHIIPLTQSMIDIIERVRDNGSIYLFPSPHSRMKPISENTLNIALKRMGYRDIMTSHGFRHTASTLLHEHIYKHQISSDVIEIQLAHVDRNSIKGVYNKALYYNERIKLMEWWSDFLDNIKKS